MALAITALALAAFTGMALAKSFTLKVAKNEKVSNITNPKQATKTESILVNSKGAAVYTLSGDTKSHPKCLDAMCRMFWPPVTVASPKTKLAAAPGVKGKLAVVHRGKIFQVTLNGRPLYTFLQDKSKGKAVGDGVVAFKGTWHVWVATSSKGTNSPPANSSLPPGY
jgi:predicted lipoprotein with Yx(FWY)xxD motif